MSKPIGERLPLEFLNMILFRNYINGISFVSQSLCAKLVKSSSTRLDFDPKYLHFWSMKNAPIQNNNPKFFNSIRVLTGNVVSDTAMWLIPYYAMVFDWNTLSWKKQPTRNTNPTIDNNKMSWECYALRSRCLSVSLAQRSLLCHRLWKSIYIANQHK